jgi:hypothetical protein
MISAVFQKMNSFNVFNEPCITSASGPGNIDVNVAGEYSNSTSIAFISIPYAFVPAAEIKGFYGHMIDTIHVFTDYKVQSNVVDAPDRVSLWVKSSIVNGT